MNDILNTEFYPTPDDVIGKMLSPYRDKLTRLQILEPNAGDGAILDYIQRIKGYNYQKQDTSHLYAIEINQDLVYILQGKGYKLIADDFLNYEATHNFDLIVMNPPFSNGDEHLLHAWNIMKNGDIVCLLNAETIDNPYTQRRKLLKTIIEQNGTVEYLGDVFKNSRRKTNVNVALVRLHKKTIDDTWHIDFDSKEDVSPDFSEALSQSSQIAVNDKIGTYLYAWEKGKQAVIDFIKARKRMDFYICNFMSAKDVSDIVNEQICKMKGAENDMTTAYNVFLDTAKAKIWKEIISKLEVDKYMTASLRENFSKFCEAQGAYELTRENIWKLVQFICMNSQEIMKKAVVDVYDTFCKYHKDNAVHIEGWKTNSQFKVNRKVILPNFVSAGYEPQRFGYDRYFRTAFSTYNTYEDIDKVMCYLSGIPYEELDTLKECVQKDWTKDKRRGYAKEDYKRLSLKKAIEYVEVGDTDLNESEFFKFRCFKKGTLHIIFKDEKLWERFNLMVNEGKKILGC